MNIQVLHRLKILKEMKRNAMGIQMHYFKMESIRRFENVHRVGGI